MERATANELKKSQLSKGKITDFPGAKMSIKGKGFCKYMFSVFLTLMLSALHITGCGGARETSKIILKFDDAVVSYDGNMCFRIGDKFFFVIASGDMKRITATDSLKLSIPANAKLLDYSAQGKRIFFASADSVFCYDMTTGLFVTMTKGAFAENVQCARSSPDGKSLAFTASAWSYGDLKFWRLVVTDAIEGGILHYSDSLPSPDAFQWVKPQRVGYIDYRYHYGKLDTIGSFYDIERHAILPTRDRGYDFLKNLCNPHISPDGKWALEMQEGVPVIRRISGAEQNGEP